MNKVVKALFKGVQSNVLKLTESAFAYNLGILWMLQGDFTWYAAYCIFQLALFIYFDNLDIFSKISVNEKELSSDRYVKIFSLGSTE